MRFNKYIIFYLLFISLALCTWLTGCVADEPWRGSDALGKLELSLNTDSGVSTKTRAADSEVSDVPGPEQFAVQLEGADGGFCKTWSNVAEFNKEPSIAMGNYKLSASWGDEKAEGFGKPWFYASQAVQVVGGEKCEVSLTATLANAMVSLRYTDKFRETFTSWDAALRSYGNEYVAYSSDETRPVFMQTGQIEMALTLTDHQGRTVTVNPASFVAEAQHHYIVTIGVDPSQTTGQLSLSVTFEENVVTESVEIPLTDELFELPEPRLAAKDFANGDLFSAIDELTLTNNPRCEVHALGGFSELVIRHESDNFTPSFGAEAQLVGASSALQSKVRESGLDVKGIYPILGTMAMIGFKSYLEHLPSGNHKITLQVKDRLTRLSEPLVLNVSIAGVDVVISSPAKAKFLDQQLVVDLSTSLGDVRNAVYFKVVDAEGNDIEAPVKSVVELSKSNIRKSTRGSDTRIFRYTLETQKLTRFEHVVKVFYGKKSLVRSLCNVAVDLPKFSVAVDPFSYMAKLKVSVEDEAMKQAVVENILFDGLNGVGNVSISRDVENGVIVIGGLTPSTLFKLSAHLAHKENPAVAVAPFNTEGAEDLPNGDFAVADPARAMLYDIKVGGSWKVSPVTYTHKSKVNRDVPAGWATINDMTCYAGSSNYNSWFMVPSTYLDNGTVVVRSVGYSHNGVTPATTGGAFNIKYYCEKTPALSEFDIAAGELFLGSYSFNGGVNRVDGVAFSSRPSGFSFDYSYQPLNGEVAEVYVKIEDASGQILYQADGVELGATDGMVRKTITIPDYGFGTKASRLYVGFRSTKQGTTPSIYIPSGSELSEGVGVLWDTTRPDNQYKSVAIGSVLTVDNAHFVYASGVGSQSVKAAKRVVKRRNKK